MDLNGNELLLEFLIQKNPDLCTRVALNLAHWDPNLFMELANQDISDGDKFEWPIIVPGDPSPTEEEEKYMRFLCNEILLLVKTNGTLEKSL